MTSSYFACLCQLVFIYWQNIQHILALKSNCMNRFVFYSLILSALLSSSITNAQKGAFTEKLKKEMCLKVQEACRHAWRGYKQYAWGYDDLRPLSKEGRNWYKKSMLMTPVDAFDTFIILGLKKEAA